MSISRGICNAFAANRRSIFLRQSFPGIGRSHGAILFRKLGLVSAIAGTQLATRTFTGVSRCDVSRHLFVFPLRWLFGTSLDE